VCCSVLQCVAVCCSVLHCVAEVKGRVKGSEARLQREKLECKCVAVCCSLLQCVAMCCSVS